MRLSRALFNSLLLQFIYAPIEQEGAGRCGGAILRDISLPNGWFPDSPRGAPNRIRGLAGRQDPLTPSDAVDLGAALARLPIPSPRAGACLARIFHSLAQITDASVRLARTKLTLSRLVGAETCRVDSQFVSCK